MKWIRIKVDSVPYLLKARNSAGMGHLARFMCSGRYSNDAKILAIAKTLPNCISIEKGG